MVLTFSSFKVNTPECVMPMVSFYQSGIFGGKQLCSERFVFKFVFQNLSHDLEFYFFPIWAKRHASAKLFGLLGSHGLKDFAGFLDLSI